MKINKIEVILSVPKEFTVNWRNRTSKQKTGLLRETQYNKFPEKDAQPYVLEELEKASERMQELGQVFKDKDDFFRKAKE